jgi:lipid-binding SYLF domain-containing protein
MRTRLFCLAVITVGSVALPGCSTAPRTPEERHELTTDSKAAIDNFTSQDPSLTDLLKNSDGYAIFPEVGKGAVAVGADYGQGEVWEGGKRVGFADMTAATIGASFGAQTFAELIVFRTPEALQRFESGQFAFDASASAVALKAGAAREVKWENDVAVFVDPKEGLMADASIGGQQFRFTSLPEANQ